MILERVLKHSKTLIKLVTTQGDTVIDATVGNGYDTLFLAQLVGESGFVYGFDIQGQAIDNTKRLLEEHQVQNVQLIQDGHENLLHYIKDHHKHQIASAIFNLGYLPQGDHSITTRGSTTIEAIKACLEVIKVNGLIVLVVYSGHEEGYQEMTELFNYFETLDQRATQVLLYRFINQRNHAPFIVAIEKVR